MSIILDGNAIAAAVNRHLAIGLAQDRKTAAAGARQPQANLETFMPRVPRAKARAAV